MAVGVATHVATALAALDGKPPDRLTGASRWQPGRARQAGGAGSSGFRQRSPGKRAKPRSVLTHTQSCSIASAAR